LHPSPEAREWGKRQAARSPRWTETKWNRIAIIFDVVLADHAEARHDQAAEPKPDRRDDHVTDSLRDAA
jgi:hypothetical protein